MSYSKAFTLQGCTDSFQAITLRAGVIFDDVYKFADAKNVTFIGGYAQGVGASSGWLMGGGHSILTPVYGLGVDRVLQIKVVTPDGAYRIANKCQNADLFWALRGSGRGTFGVVIESTHLVEPKLTFQTTVISFTPTPDNTRSFFELIVSNTVKWANEGWGGHVTDGGMIYVTPLLSLEEAAESMKAVTDYSITQGGTGLVETSLSWLDFFTKYVVGHQGPIGQLIVLGTRLIPKSNFESEGGKTQLIDVLMDLRATLINIATVTPILYNATSATDTSVTPAWRDALWHLPQGARWSYNSSVPEIVGAQTFLHKFVDRFRALAPDSGAYLNEAEVYETDHEAAFWGSNYARLLQIKKK
ncbi:hypothetical protein Hypma_000138 [Hypsizygus marmoreus]|uniref:FAD-binding PCMH-type domain-containing protein n=1 Tax=Hypsizygus marmoreus TaxID=39966 RepID=A0A369KGP9_HYPMA|nr:hypothetical protein Hypma_000138 [Hypsizygus marmoreus]